MARSESDSTPETVWFITGCSTGLGHALAEAVLNRPGMAAVITARNPASLDGLVQSHPGRALALALDVTDQASIDRAIFAADQWKGGIDVLVNNAGFGTIGGLEEVDDTEAGIAFDANFYGVYRVTRAALPNMRKRRKGHILNISSMLGFVGAAGFSFYSAAKFAVEGLSEALAKEVAPFGIKVTIVEPGPFRTDFRSRSMRMAPLHPSYAETLGVLRKNLAATDGQQPGDPKRGANAIIDVTLSENPPLRLPLGSMAITQFRQKVADLLRDIDTWEASSRATDFPKEATASS